MDKNHIIYDIEPTSTVEGVLKKHLKNPNCLLYHIQIEGGCKEFYDRYGPKALRDAINTLRLNLFSKRDEFKMHANEITSIYGDMYAISENPIDLNATTIMVGDEPLELRISIDKVK